MQRSKFRKNSYSLSSDIFEAIKRDKNIAVPPIERHSWKLDEYHNIAKAMAVGDSVALRPRQEMMDKDADAEQTKVLADANCLIARIRRIYGLSLIHI